MLMVRLEREMVSRKAVAAANVKSMQSGSQIYSACVHQMDETYSKH